MATSDQPPIPIIWRGPETAAEIQALLRPAAAIDVHLAEEYHHALFRALHPRASAGEPEELDSADGAELLRRVAKINGLEGINALVAPLERVHAQVHISGRAKIAITVPEDAGPGD